MMLPPSSILPTWQYNIITFRCWRHLTPRAGREELRCPSQAAGTANTENPLPQSYLFSSHTVCRPAITTRLPPC
jgi:hypothetical protein